MLPPTPAVLRIENDCVTMIESSREEVLYGPPGVISPHIASMPSKRLNPLQLPPPGVYR